MLDRLNLQFDHARRAYYFDHAGQRWWFKCRMVDDVDGGMGNGNGGRKLELNAEQIAAVAFWVAKGLIETEAID